MEKAVPRFLGDEGLGPDYERQLDEALDRLETLPGSSRMLTST